MAYGGLPDVRCVLFSLSCYFFKNLGRVKLEDDFVSFTVPEGEKF